MGKFVKWIKIITINLITAVVLLALTNWLCGVYLRNRDQAFSRESLPNYDTERELAEKVFRDYASIKHEYEPFVGWKCLPYRGETLTISDEGERIHAAPVTNRGESRVIRFFGGSTMWGEGSDNQHTIPALFNQLNPDWRVTNHAQLAYNTRQELDALITLYTTNKKADVVVFYDGVNDAAFLCPKEITELPAHRLVPMYRENLYGGRMRVIKAFAYKVFAEHLVKVVNKYREKTQNASPYDCMATPGKAEQIASIVMQNWELAHQIVTAHGGRFIALLQPAAYVGSPRTDHLKLDPDLGQNFAEVYKHLQRMIKERNHPWIYDLSDSFDGNEHIYIDFCHVSPNGNRIIAEKISSLVNDDPDGSEVVSLVSE